MRVSKSRSRSERVEDARARAELQEIVLGYRWCGFNNAQRWIGEFMLAIVKDLLGTLDMPLSPKDQTLLNGFVFRSAIPSLKYHLLMKGALSI